MLALYQETQPTNNPDFDLLNEKKNIGKSLITTFSDNLFEFTIKRETYEKDGKEFNKKIAYENIFIDVFKKQESNKPQDISLQLENFEQIDLEDQNLTSFLSNINFFDKLCNICEIMRVAKPDAQLNLLHNELNIINKQLPSNIYIPFLSERVRNYVIVHIPVSETRIFRTKNRAPYMLTVEVIRIDELILSYLNSVRKNKISNHEKLEAVRSYSFQNSKKTNEIFDKNKKKKVSQTEKEKKKKSNTLKNHDENNPSEFLKEQDVILSQPVMLRNLNKQIGSQKMKLENKYATAMIEEEEEYKKIDKYVKQRVTISYNNLDPNGKRKNLNHSANIFQKNEIDNSINQHKNSDISGEIILKGRDDLSVQKPQASTKPQIIEEEIKTTEKKIEEDKVSEVYPSQIFYEGIQADKEVDSIFGEKIEEQTARLKKFSPFGDCSSWKLFKIIIKSGEDLRQEQFATQLINEFNQIFHLENVDMWLKPYEILSTGPNMGIIECVPNAVSLDYLKRKAKNMSNLRQFFENYFGNVEKERFKKAISNFIRSLAAYSLVCYFLQIKDRHNGNILIDDQGHIIHIDFGFLLSNAPGKGIQFEKAPFKLTNEFVEVMGGINSPNFSKFRKLLWKGFIAASKHREKIIMLVEMMYCGHGNNLPCFLKGHETIIELRQRFSPRKNMKKHDHISHVDKLIESSIDNWRTKWYDKFQYWFQGIFY